VPWIDESVALGYKRALILKAQATLFEIEERSGGFPPPSEKDYAELVGYVTRHLERARKEGVRETYIVSTQVEQVFSRLKMNSAILSPIYREMIKPPTDANCEPRYGKIGEYSDGKPMIGMIDNCYSNPFLR